MLNKGGHFCNHLAENVLQSDKFEPIGGQKQSVVKNEPRGAFFLRCCLATLLDNNQNCQLPRGLLLIVQIVGITVGKDE